MDLEIVHINNRDEVKHKPMNNAFLYRPISLDVKNCKNTYVEGESYEFKAEHKDK